MRSRSCTTPKNRVVPAGSGSTSGQWTRGLSLLGDLSAAAAEYLEEFALSLGGAAAAFGLLFISVAKRP